MSTGFAQSNLKKDSTKPGSSLVKSVSNLDSSATGNQEKYPQKDIKDVIEELFKHKTVTEDSVETKNTRKHYSFVPAIGYTLTTGFAGIISGNMAYFTDTGKDTKISSATVSFTYSQYNQTIIPIQASIWSKGNRFNYITDFRYINYPSPIFGLGGRQDPNTGYTIDFSGLKIHQTIMKALSNNMYVGIGYYFDRFWDIKPLDSVSLDVNQRISKELGVKETASGITFRLLYDSRLNQINPQQGLYYSITYRTSSRAFGADSTWQSIQIDARAYIQFPKNTENVLAFWMFDWLTAGGTPPYLLLPSTGWDDSYNTGRGYQQGRFRGKDFNYFETEYRFRVTRDGLLGGVVFGNIENVSSLLDNQYTKIFPGYGVGLRVKLNKFSRANLCVDYGIGENGSGGFYVNLGEVF